jgi:lysophospholipid acyltransferase (LPLAT)-like uncharacterized protein
MNLKKVKRGTLNFLGNLLIKTSVTLLCKSLKINISNKKVIDDLINMNKNFVVAFWHGTMLVPWFIQDKKNISALVSQSKDGDILTKLLEHWDYKVVRGSSSAGGDDALENIIDLLKNNYSVAITPDGPRGPQFKFKAGAVVAAKKSNVPLLLLGTGYKSKKILKSWDHFEVPHFFSKVNIILSDPIEIPENLTYEDISDVIYKCEQQLNDLQKQASLFN